MQHRDSFLVSYQSEPFQQKIRILLTRLLEEVD